LTLMGAATVGIGLTSTYALIGILAPVLLIFFSLIHGRGSRGEWGSALLLATEYAPESQRGFFGAVPQVSVTICMIIGSSSFYLMTSMMSEELFLSIGWRIPFILSAFLVLFGLWIRKDLDETPEFRASMESGKIPKVPIVD